MSEERKGIGEVTGVKGGRKKKLFCCRGENRTSQIDTSCARMPTSMVQSSQLKRFPAVSGDLMINQFYGLSGVLFYGHVGHITSTWN